MSVPRPPRSGVSAGSDSDRRSDRVRRDGRGSSGPRGPRRPPGGPPDFVRDARPAPARPVIDDDVELSVLDRTVLGQLRTLPDRLAELVGGHLVMAARLLEVDPEAALDHARAARDLAPRLVCVREGVAEAAYAVGDFGVAGREARTVRRMTGDDAWLPLIADCERGLGRADRALEILSAQSLESLRPEIRAEAVMVKAGARADLGQDDAALATLDCPLLRVRERSDWVARLRFAYAEALLRLDRRDEALKWLRLATAGDPEGITGAGVRLAELEGVTILDVEAEPEG